MPVLFINVARWLAPARSARHHETRHYARARVADMAEQQARRRVLIVEDEPALRNHYERFFSSRYNLTFASSGAEALERLSEATPDVAVLDMRLPDTDGVALLREIHESQPALPVIIATAFHSIEPQLQLLDVPYADYIVKPFRLDELGARIDAAL
jgi:DNA-binding response OmpR family regulator